MITDDKYKPFCLLTQHIKIYEDFGIAKRSLADYPPADFGPLLSAHYDYLKTYEKIR